MDNIFVLMLSRKGVYFGQKMELVAREGDLPSKH